MAGHAPFIMPDGRSLAAVLRAEATATPGKTDNKKKKQQRGMGKDELWGQLQRNKSTAMSDQELAEIRAIERVGHRRRRQWLNDKLLRDLAGPMHTHDMEAQFKPVPFGSYPPPSAFMLASAPEHAALWDHFRSIDADKEAKVLQRWEAHNRQQQQHQGLISSSQGRVLLSSHQQQEAAAAAALAKWSAVGRSARAALKKASVHSVLELEMQLMQLMEQGDPNASLLLDLPDSFARLLVHGLAQFHNLHSATRIVDGSKQLLLRRQQARQQATSPQQEQQQDQDSPAQPSPALQHHTAVDAAEPSGSVTSSQQGQQLHQESCSSSSSLLLSSSATAAAGNPVAGGGGVPPCVESAAGHQVGADWLLHHADITCTDVVMALRELGGAFDQHSLGTYMRTVHGTNSEVHSEDALLV